METRNLNPFVGQFFDRSHMQSFSASRPGAVMICDKNIDYWYEKTQQMAGSCNMFRDVFVFRVNGLRTRIYQGLRGVQEWKDGGSLQLISTETLLLLEKILLQMKR